MLIIVEPNLQFNYLNINDHRFVCGAITPAPGKYIISKDTLYSQQQTVRASISNGSRVVVDITDESVATQRHLKDKFPKLCYLSGGETELGDVANINNEHFLAATIGSNPQFTPDTPMIYDHLRERPYNFLFLNRKMRPHRRYMVANLHKKGLLENALWSCLESHTTWAHNDFNRKYDEDSNITIQKLPIVYHPDPMPDWYDGVVFEQMFRDTWFSLVNETHFEYNASFRTEKIYKTILAGHPFVVIANRHFLLHLVNLGFKTFGDFWDERYDWEEEPIARMEKIIKLVDDLQKKDWKQLWQVTEEIRIHNRNHLFHLHTTQHNTFTNKLVKWFN
jgi:hypothetical protein|tara:strand:- start:1954 stop:2958 length:1005 start_codon:yes stop_codon:yes gene_type:complete